MEDVQFVGAGIVAAVFKVAAWIVIAGGIYAVLWVNGHADTVTSASRVKVTVAAGTVLLASTLAFFGYVLDVLRALVLESRRK